MSVRPPDGLRYPCYWMYRDDKKLWRWVYYGDNAEEIAVSSESYVNKADCRRGVDIMRASHNSEIFAPKDS